MTVSSSWHPKAAQERIKELEEKVRRLEERAALLESRIENATASMRAIAAIADRYRVDVGASGY